MSGGRGRRVCDGCAMRSGAMYGLCCARRWLVVQAMTVWDVVRGGRGDGEYGVLQLLDTCFRTVFYDTYSAERDEQHRSRPVDAQGRLAACLLPCFLTLVNAGP
jgi:hypothetical protein